MQLFKYKDFVSIYDEYGTYEGIVKGKAIDVKECEPQWIYEMYLRGEISFIQCRRLLKECGKQVDGEIANIFKVGNHSNDIDILTEYFKRSQEERNKCYQRFITYCRKNDKDMFDILIRNYVFFNEYVFNNNWSVLLDLASESATIEYINEYLKN
jgi:hypothetical protein